MSKPKIMIIRINPDFQTFFLGLFRGYESYRDFYYKDPSALCRVIFVCNVNGVEVCQRDHFFNYDFIRLLENQYTFFINVLNYICRLYEAHDALRHLKSIEFDLLKNLPKVNNTSDESNPLNYYKRSFKKLLKDKIKYIEENLNIKYHGSHVRMRIDERNVIKFNELKLTNEKLYNDILDFFKSISVSQDDFEAIMIEIFEGRSSNKDRIVVKTKDINSLVTYFKILVIKHKEDVRVYRKYIAKYLSMRFSHYDGLETKHFNSENHLRNLLKGRSLTIDENRTLLNRDFMF